MAKSNPLRHNGKLYDLGVPELAELAGRGLRWVYVHQDELGGVKKIWGEGRRQTVRFPSAGIKKVLKDLGLTPVAA